VNISIKQETDKETVENLEGWEIKKNSYKSLRASYHEKLAKKAEEYVKEKSDEIIKLQAKKAGLPYRNAMIFETVRAIQSPTHIQPRRVLSTQREFKQNTPLMLNLPIKSFESPKESVKSPMKKLKIEANIVTKNMDYEATMACKIRHLKEVLEKKKKQLSHVLRDKNNILKNISDLKSRIAELKQTEKEQNLGNMTSRGIHCHNASNKNVTATFLQATEMSIAQAKIKRRHMIGIYGDQINDLRKEIENKATEINEITEKIESVKFEMSKLKEEQSEYFHKLLSEGMDTRQEGLCWIIKAIWVLGKNVNLSKIPIYLDEKAVAYLFEYSRKDMELEKYREKASKIYNTSKSKENEEENEDDNNENEEDEYQGDTIKMKENALAEVEKIMENLRKDLKDLKDKEYRRITREFTSNNYGQKFNTSIVTILCALFGYDFMIREIDKFPKAKAILKSKQKVTHGSLINFENI